MYSLDINFLNDRPEYRSESGRSAMAGSSGGGGFSQGRAARSSYSGGAQSRTPLVLGILSLLLFPLLALGGLLYFQSENSRLEQEGADLDNKLGNLKALQQEADGFRKQVTQINEEIDALKTIFDGIKPWSALMQDLKDRIPSGVQILKVVQVPPEQGVTPSPAASPPPANAQPPELDLEISGIAADADQVNDFMLVLKNSSFLNASGVRILDTKLQQAPTKIPPIAIKNPEQNAGATAGGPITEYSIPQQYTFSIRAPFSNEPASNLLREIERKGATGLVTRIEELQRKGVLKK